MPNRSRLEDLTRGVSVRGILPNSTVTVVDVQWHGPSAVQLTYQESSGRLGQELLYRDREATIEVLTTGLPWSFDGDGAVLRLAAEAKRIRLAYLFDPLLAVHSSDVRPLPHQITAVYHEMLSRQPLRFVLADDPGAGKTIMAGLLIKELLVRGDVERCLIVCPGSLVEQWQDELDSRFHLPFDILTNEAQEHARTGNWFMEHPLAIARLDKLSRDEAIQAKLKHTDWDLVICDEAHKLSATFYGGGVRYTRRYHLGKLLAQITRHFLLLTATPHNGKEADFQLFLALLDADRFEGKFRNGVHTTDVSDLMRRMLKEDMLTFDSTPLFPERIAATINYTLSADEAALYQQVTTYVRDEFNRADALGNDGRKGTVGFALTTLQRRLASSPEAIYQSLRRRRERLARRLHEERQLKHERDAALDWHPDIPSWEHDDLDELDDAPAAELESAEDQVVDQATAARTIAELENEIATLARLESLALHVRRSGSDRKWEELSHLLQSSDARTPNPTPDGQGASVYPLSPIPYPLSDKLVIFTEHRDTLRYLAERIRALLGRAEAVVTIAGGMSRDERAAAQQAFTHDTEVRVLVATDAAGEGINLQRAHLMVNYDLPWNPNRLEQRFGRIHRIGQTQVCYLWNLVAAETREGDVYQRLLQKLEQERAALGGRVFNVLGRITFNNRSLRELLLEAIRYGDQPEVAARLSQVVDGAFDRDVLRDLLDEYALAHDAMDISQVRRIREDMERAEARRLQPHFIGSFFLEAFRHLGGTIREREPRRYEVTHVPAALRNRSKQLGARVAVMPRYERVTFEKERMHHEGMPPASLVCPGHPLLDATIDLVLERYSDVLKQGAVLVDPADPGEDVRVLVLLEHAIQDGRVARDGSRRVLSRQLQAVEVDMHGNVRNAGLAPYLDYSIVDIGVPIMDVLEQSTIHHLLSTIEDVVMAYAIEHVVPVHLHEVKQRKEALIAKTKRAVHDRLTKEIMHWDNRAVKIRVQEDMGKTPRINSARAHQRVADLQARLARRMAELEDERTMSPQPPIIIGGALILPDGLRARLAGEHDAATPALFARETARVEQIAMQAVMEQERALGYEPRDVSAERCGYDIESRIPASGRLRFIEVKGRIRGARTVTVTHNEILTALNKPDDWYLALVEVDPSADVAAGDTVRTVSGIAERRAVYETSAAAAAGSGSVRYVPCPFTRQPDFAATSVNYDVKELLAGED